MNKGIVKIALRMKLSHSKQRVLLEMGVKYRLLDWQEVLQVFK